MNNKIRKLLVKLTMMAIIAIMIMIIYILEPNYNASCVEVNGKIQQCINEEQC